MARQDRAVLTALSLGYFTVTVDASALAVALPAIRDSFDGSVQQLQWVSNAYVIAFAGSLLSAGRFADRFGPRTMYLAGALGLAVSSLLCALAPSIGILVAARVLQGLAGAVLTTAAFAMLAHTFTDASGRAHAFSTLSFFATIGLAGGPVLGGALIEVAGWQSIFFLNLGVAAVLFGVLRNVQVYQRPEVLTLDVKGQVLGISTLASLAIALIQHSLVAGIAAVLLFAAFVRAEHTARSPMLALQLFRTASFSAGNVIIALWRGSLYGSMFLLGIYFEMQLHYSSFEAGMAFLPLTVAMFPANAYSGRLGQRFGIRKATVIGQAVSATGAFVVVAGGTHPPLAIILLGTCILGFGAGVAIPNVNNFALAGIPKQYAGVASGVYNACGQTGSLIGIAVIGGFAASITTKGLQPAMIVAAGALVTSAVLCARFAALPAVPVSDSVRSA